MFIGCEKPTIMFPFWFYIEWSKQKFNNLQAWILGPDIEQCPAKDRVMFDESCFTTDTIVQREIKEFISYQRLKTQKHSVRKGLSRSWFSFYEHCIRQFTLQFFIFQTVRFYTNTLLFFALRGTASPLKTFYMASRKTYNLKKM